MEVDINIKDRNKKLGIYYILGAAFGFALMGLCARLSGDLPTFEKVFFRNIVAAFFSGVLIIKNKESFGFEKKNLIPLIIRASAGTLGLICNFYAIDNMNIADANMLNKLSPFFAMIFSIIIMKEKAKLFDWVATIIAFLGALLIVKPGFSSTVNFAIIGVMGGLFAGMAYTAVRYLGNRGMNSNLIVFYFSAFSTVATLPLLIMNFRPMSLRQFLILLLAGFWGMVGQFCVTRAYKYARAKEISVFDYTQVVFSAILGFLVLGQLPDIYSYIGYTIVIGIAIVRWHINLKSA